MDHVGYSDAHRMVGHFIVAAHGLLKEVLDADLPVATYVVVDEIAADAWGYDGLTQEARRPTDLVDRR